LKINTERKVTQFGWPFFFLIISLLVAVCYVQTINYPFVWDDEEMVVNNPLIKEWRYLPQIFQTSAFAEVSSSPKFYRPLQIITYLFNYKLHGLSVHGFHIVNIVLHIFSSFFVFLLFRLFRFGKTGDWLSLIYAVHPMHVESVTYISGRGDCLYLFFSLLFLLSYFLGRLKNKWFYSVAIISFSFAILSKENSVLVPFIILAYECSNWVIVKLKKKRNPSSKGQSDDDVFGGKGSIGEMTILDKPGIVVLLILVLVSAIYGMFRVYSVANGNSVMLSPIAELNFYQKCLTLTYSFTTYFKLLFFPYPLHMEYLYVVKSFFNSYVLIWFPIIVLIFLAVLTKLAKFSLNSIPFICFCLAWFFVGLLPTLSLVTPMASTLREHWITFPALGLFCLIALLLHNLFDREILNIRMFRRRVFNREIDFLTIGCVVLIAYFSFFTVLRNKDWESAKRLFSHDLKYEPNSFVLWNNLGVEYYRDLQFELAKDAFQKSVDTSPNKAYAIALNNLGGVNEYFGNIDEAIHYYKLGIKHGLYKLSYTNLASIYIRQGHYQLAIDLLIEAETSFPYDYELNYLMSFCYFQTGNYTSFQHYLRRVPPNYKNVGDLIKSLQ
jgi:protein O-mannosyl-transferase